MATIYHSKKGENDKWSKMQFNHIVEIVISLSNIAPSKNMMENHFIHNAKMIEIKKMII